MDLLHLHEYLNIFGMNWFRLIGDMFHLAAMLLLLHKIFKTKSCTGISGRTQIILATVFITRYSNLFSTFISLYNTTFKVIFIVSTVTTTYLIYDKFNHTYDKKHDTFPLMFVYVPCAMLALIFNYDFNWFEVLWTFSMYLEAAAIIPQLYMTRKMGYTQYMKCYLLYLALYRIFYAINWVYRYLDQNSFDPISYCAGAAQIIMFTTFLCIGCNKPELETNVDEENLIGDKKSSPLDLNISETDRQLMIAYIQRKDDSQKRGTMNLSKSAEAELVHNQYI